MKLEKKMYISGPFMENDIEIHSLCPNPMGEDDTLYIRADLIQTIIEDLEKKVKGHQRTNTPLNQQKVDIYNHIIKKIKNLIQ